ncbi:hypothetical protein DM01DRAFT_1384111 [Hesseltinella vesiculosa]|uniref:Actin cytoskeleton-regulatory complex protein SLA1 n=1 Tax=Hesseltinella vesiculosa TaxID=101127 RepID=A0A1X2GFA3_9FUNG|nr:hypothetical protein DM01DRAFT_1384111 [Hesseltinella vesiculosa]
MKYLEVCQALYDYEARTPDEISIQENDIIYIVEKEDDEWWKGELKQGDEPGPVGLVPASYVEEVTPVGMVRAEFDYDAQQEEELSIIEGQEMWVYERDDPDWFLVKLDTGDLGLVPSNYVQDIDEDAPAPAAPAVDPTPPPAPVTITPPQPTVQPTLATASPSTPTRGTPVSSPKVLDVDDEAQSWTVNVYDVAKKKKKKSKGNLLVGNGLLCFGSETDKASPVQQYEILDVDKYLMDSKVLHIEINGAQSAVLDLQASSKSEAKAIINKISESRQLAQRAGTHVKSTSQSNARIAPPSATLPPPTNGRPSAAAVAAADRSPSPPLMHPRPAIALFDFQAEGGEELSVKENEEILVTNYRRDDGWWHIQSMVDYNHGIIPKDYIQFTDDDSEPARDVPQPSLPPRPSVTIDADGDVVYTEAHDEVEHYFQYRDDPEYREHKELERQIAENERKEMQRRKEDEDRRREEEDRERDRRRKAQEAAQRQELERQRRMDEERRRREREQAKNERDDLPKPDPDRLRTWTDRSASFRVDAQYLAFSDGKLRLHKSNGVKIDVPIEKMSDEDVRWVERHNNMALGTLSGKKRVDKPQEKTPEMPTRPAGPLSAFSDNPPSTSASHSSNRKKPNPSWDWFDWFMKVGIPMQQALIYSSAFQGDRLDDSDLDRLTYKQFKSLGVKENHIRRIERYLDTGKLEAPSDDEGEGQNHDQQIKDDEAYARELQNQLMNEPVTQRKEKEAKAKTASKQIHPDLLDLLGSDFDTGASASTSNNGFSDDAWAPRPTKDEQEQKPVLDSIPLQPQPSAAPQPMLALPAPTPQPPASAPASTPVPDATANKTIDPTLHQWSSASAPATSPEKTRQNASLNDIKMQDQMQRYQQQQRQQALIDQQQQMIMQQQQHIANQQIQHQQLQIQQLQQPLLTGQPMVLYQQSQVTGMPMQAQMTGLPTMQAQMTGFVPQQQQMTGFVSPAPTLPQMHAPQQPAMTGFGASLSPFQAQPTGWQASTPDNPFGSGSSTTPMYQQLQPQMTGVQQTELSGNRDKYAPFRTPGADVFTPSGSMQHGQGGFGQRQGQGW